VASSRHPRGRMRRWHPTTHGRQVGDTGSQRPPRGALVRRGAAPRTPGSGVTEGALFYRVRGHSSVGRAPALQAHHWRRPASVSVGNTGFLRQVRWWASASAGAVFGTVFQTPDAIGGWHRDALCRPRRIRTSAARIGGSVLIGPFPRPCPSFSTSSPTRPGFPTLIWPHQPTLPLSSPARPSAVL